MDLWVGCTVQGRRKWGYRRDKIPPGNFAAQTSPSKGFKLLVIHPPEASRFSDLPTVLLYVHLLNPIFFYPLASAAAQCQYYVLYLLRIQFFACNVCILRMNNWKCNIYSKVDCGVQRIKFQCSF